MEEVHAGRTNVSTELTYRSKLADAASENSPGNWPKTMIATSLPLPSNNHKFDLFASPFRSKLGLKHLIEP
jgi:hypothetical protein